MRDTSKIGLTYSPTVNPISFFIVLAITATKPNHTISSYDVKGAFLNTVIPDNIFIYVEVDKELGQLFIEKYPYLASMSNPDGTICFRLRRYLYGLQESPLAWNKTLHLRLTEIGFTQSKCDPCAYTLIQKEETTYLTVHVDDMLLSSPSIRRRLWFENKIKKHFEISSQVNQLTYLGMTYLGMSVIKNEEGIYVHQIGYIDTLGIKFGIDPEVRTNSPTGTDFLKVNQEDESIDSSKYLSLVMSLMYLARFTRYTYGSDLPGD